MTNLEMRFLGGLNLSRDGASLFKFKSDKGKAMLSYLAVTGQPHSRAALAGLLWPESPEVNARLSLRRTLTGIRKIAPDCLNTTRRTVGVHADAPIWVDVTRFEQLVTAPSNIDRLQEAAALYQGDFLEQFNLLDAPAFDIWTLGQRARLREMVLEALHTIAAHFAQRREFEAAVSYTRRSLNIEPWRENVHRELMRCLVLSGQRSAALKQYEICCQLLADELGVAPAAETTSLYEQIRNEELSAEDRHTSLAAENSRQVYLDSISPPGHNLPAAVTKFVGREAELNTMAALIADPQVRIITITGPGGIGKTRLALEAASREIGLQSSFRDGVFFVSLALLKSEDDIVTALAAALKFQFHGPGKELEQLLHYLREKQMLLIMDNFEHILGGQALLAEISRRAANIKMLVTSRERLQMRGEQLFPLQGLELAQNAESATEAPAAKLFLHTARRTGADFQLFEGDEEHILRICQLVGGMPLGLELAAAWVSLLPLSEIAAEIEQSLNLLVAEHSDVPPRHQSIKTALDVSWRRLTSEQQRAFQELTVFQGGFTREAALAVANVSLSLLAALANKSWLSYDRLKDRYHIHALLRRYGTDKLSIIPAHHTLVRERHAAYFVATLKNEKQLGSDHGKKRSP